MSSSEISSDSEYFSANSDSEDSWSDVDIDEELEERFLGLKLEPYQFEPEKANFPENENDEEQVSSVDLCKQTEEKMRLHSLSWCLCGSCKEERREIDCLCCKEVDAISDEQFSGIFQLPTMSTIYKIIYSSYF